MSIFRENPVLGREIGIRLRLSRYSKANRIAIYGTLLGVLPLIYFVTLRMLFVQTSNNTGRDFYLIWMMLIEMTTALLLPAALTASAITGEREKQTWNALLLARLSDGQIVFGKLIGALVPAAILFVLFLPINVISGWAAGITLKHFLAGHAILFSTALLSASLGMFCSWAFRRTQIALVTTVLGLLMIGLGTPLLLALAQMTLGSQSVQAESFVPLWLNPYYALSRFVEPGSFRNSEHVMTGAVGITYLGFATLASAMMLFTVTMRLKLGPQELTH
jgi:ABC-type transport system involved in multi-copper enzyme maturation permease subunit